MVTANQKSWAFIHKRGNREKSHRKTPNIISMYKNKEKETKEIENNKKIKDKMAVISPNIWTIILNINRLNEPIKGTY